MKKMIYILPLLLIVLMPSTVFARSIEGKQMNYENNNYTITKIQDTDDDTINDTDNDGLIDDNDVTDNGNDINDIYDNDNDTDLDNEVIDDDDRIFDINGSFWLGLVIGVIGSYLIMLLSRRTTTEKDV